MPYQIWRWNGDSKMNINICDICKKAPADNRFKVKKRWKWHLSTADSYFKQKNGLTLISVKIAIRNYLQVLVKKKKRINDFAIIASPIMKGVIYMNTGIYYDTIDCMKLIKKKYPWIPMFIVRRVLFAEELYMHKMGIIDWKPDLKSWSFKK